MTTEWYLDSSVGVRVITGESRAAQKWMTKCVRSGDIITSSYLHRLEVSRVALRLGLRQFQYLNYVSALDFRIVTQDQIARAEAIPHYLKTLDTIHIQCALDIISEGRQLTVVTHDAAMSRVATALGLAVHDPVTDDPKMSALVQGLLA